MNGKFTIGELQDYYHCIWSQKFRTDADEAQKLYRRLYQPQDEKERKRIASLISGEQQLSVLQQQQHSLASSSFRNQSASSSHHHRRHHRHRSHHRRAHSSSHQKGK
jgi:hypothetical protein